MAEATPQPRPSHAWIASLISTVVTLPLAFVVLVFGGLSPMACDSCSESGSDRFDTSFEAAWAVLSCGLVLALIVLIASWVFKRRRPPTCVSLAVLAPGTVVITWAAFMALIDWP
ncbi:hypothetical protein [Streptomyces sp. NBC_01217]|uniref:hypothetical protein n=1 Tax=Streptomyces sp. NBC_01217 TaxID=2903779 RepID=UPI002E150D2A|nr:hypothetical protein OG507_17505 [Streptomyces sp. NBC_01217]